MRRPPWLDPPHPLDAARDRATRRARDRAERQRHRAAGLKARHARKLARREQHQVNTDPATVARALRLLADDLETAPKTSSELAFIRRLRIRATKLEHEESQQGDAAAAPVAELQNGDDS